MGQTHQDAIVRYLRAQAAAMRFIHDPKNRGEVSRIIKEITGEPQAIVDHLVANYADPKLRILPRQGELDMASFNNLLQFAKDAGYTDKPFPPTEKFVDLTFAKAAGIQ